MARLTAWMVDEMVYTLIDKPDACLVVHGVEGIPRIKRNGKTVRLHRYLYFAATGTELSRSVCLQAGRCGGAGCLNPFHFEITRRRAPRKRKRCPNGHEYTPSNTLHRGRARCRTCYEAMLARRRTGKYPNGYCRKGHRISGDNVYVSRRGDGGVDRRCRRCGLERRHAYNERRRAKSGQR